MTKEELAGLLYDSLYNRILPLSDDIMVYPAHGAGSACGKNMMKETMDSLGNQKKVNYALKQPSKESFIKAVTDGLLPPPGYFGMNVAMNKKGYSSFDEVLHKSLRPLNPEELKVMLEASDALVLDVREAGVFHKGFIPRSINIGALIVDVKQSIILVAEPGQEEEAVTRLSRVGFDHVVGYLDGGFKNWMESGNEIDTVERISAHQFKSTFSPGKTRVIDVRKESEYQAEHVEGSDNLPLATINEWFSGLTSADTFYLHCAGGYRSMMAASILKSRGIHNFKEVEGGFKAIAEVGVPKTNFVCTNTVSEK
jgi:rhodanese-related sulfurtransferase